MTEAWASREGKGPFAGLKVLEFAGEVAGPHRGMFLTEAGPDVLQPPVSDSLQIGDIVATLLFVPMTCVKSGSECAPLIWTSVSIATRSMDD